MFRFPSNRFGVFDYVLRCMSNIIQAVRINTFYAGHLFKRVLYKSSMSAAE